MNNDFNRNTRTLLISFVFALMVMIPLRFVEVNNNTFGGSAMVLGDSVETTAPKLEAPYDVLEIADDCLSNEYVDQVISFLTDESEIEYFNMRRCN